MRWTIRRRGLPGDRARVLAALLCLVLAGLTWYYNARYIPRLLAEQEARLRASLDLAVVETRSVVMLRPGYHIEKGRQITREMLEYFEVVSWPAMFLPEAVLDSPEALVGMMAAKAMAPREVLGPDWLHRPEERVEGYYRLVNVEIRDAVLDTLVEGRYLDLLAHRGDGTYEVLVTKVPAVRVGTGKAGTTEVVIPVDDYEQRLIERVRDQTEFTARVYLDAAQPRGPVTYPGREGFLEEPW